MSAADLLLLGDEMSVAKIAKRVGCRGASHFSKEFKRLYGESPGRYVSMLRLRLSAEPSHSHALA